MTDEMLKKYLEYKKNVNDRLEADDALGDAWSKIDKLLETTKDVEGETYAGLDDVIHSHFDLLSDGSRPSISFILDMALKGPGSEKGCIILKEDQEREDNPLVEAASYPYAEVEGKRYVSAELIGTVLDLIRQGYAVDPNTDWIEGGDLEDETPGRGTPRHPKTRARKARNCHH